MALHFLLTDGVEGRNWSCAMMEAPLPRLTAAKNIPVVHTCSCGFLRVNRKG